MKYVLIIGDGMADNPVSELGNLTPLEYLSKNNEKPHIDKLASRGTLALAKTCPDVLEPGSDTGILSIFGYDPLRFYTGRAPLEAAASGIVLNPGSTAFRCNMVSLGHPLGDANAGFENLIMRSHSAGGIDGETSDKLVTDLFSDSVFSEAAKEAGITAYPSGSFRHLAVQEGASSEGIEFSPPHNHLGETVADILPKGGDNAAVLSRIIRLSYDFLSRHPLNQERIEHGLLPANSIWFWASGTAVNLPSFYNKYGKTAAVISAVPLCHGIAALAKIDRIHVPGATGELDTDYEGKVEAAVEALKTRDFAAIHIEAPDECTHNGDLEGKLEAIRRIDSRIVAPLIERLGAEFDAFRLFLISDHKTLSGSGKHDGDPVPYIMFDSRYDQNTGLSYDESAAAGSELTDPATKLMGVLFDS